MSNRMSRPDLVRKLTSMWNTYYKQNTYLKSVAIGDGEPMRGIKNSKLEFNFPLTVICGPNGTGKTTFMALSILAFHSEDSLSVLANRLRYFDFKYFFGFSDKDKHEEGIVIEWHYTDDKSDMLVKGKERWMRYIRNSKEPRRPVRGTEFIGISRIVPAFEKKGYGKLFSNKKKYIESTRDTKVCEYLTRIVSKKYSSVASYTHKNSLGAHSINAYNSTHTSFNAGAGEECLTNILSILLGAKEGSIVAIEEIEIGLHPATLKHLVDVLLEIIKERKLQVIITTHSPEFLRACPKESLVLAERVEVRVHFTHKPNVEYAVHNLSGNCNTDLYVVCEDEVAASLIRASMTKKQRNLAEIKEFGSKNELIKKAEVINTITGKKVLIVWDGDVQETEMAGADTANNIHKRKLPGESSPEDYLRSTLLTQSGESYLRGQYNLDDADWNSLKSKIESIQDIHDLIHIISDELEYDENTLRDTLCRFTVQQNVSDFNDIKEAIAALLE